MTSGNGPGNVDFYAIRSHSRLNGIVGTAIQPGRARPGDHAIEASAVRAGSAARSTPPVSIRRR